MDCPILSWFRSESDACLEVEVFLLVAIVVCAKMNSSEKEICYVKNANDSDAPIMISENQAFYFKFCSCYRVRTINQTFQLCYKWEGIDQT